jgi:hypothetical protein
VAASSDWTKVTALRADTRIEAHLSDGRQVTGALTAVNSDEIVLDYTSVLRRDLVLALWVVRGDNQKTAFLAGAAIGLILGAASESTGNDAIIVSAVLAVIGSTLGAEITEDNGTQVMAYMVRRVCFGLLVSHAAMLVLALASSSIWYAGWRTGGFGVAVIAGLSAAIGVGVVVHGVLRRSAVDVGWGAAVLTFNVLPWIAVLLVGWHIGE